MNLLQMVVESIFEAKFYMIEREVEIELKLNGVENLKFLIHKVFLQFTLNLVERFNFTSHRLLSISVIVPNIRFIFMIVRIINLSSNKNAESCYHKSVEFSKGKFFLINVENIQSSATDSPANFHLDS